MNAPIETAAPRKRAKTTEELIEELYRTEGKAEIINGKIVKLPFDGCSPSLAIGNIVFNLNEYKKRTKSGVVFMSKVAFLVDLPHRKSISASCSFYTGERTGMKFPKGAPLFAVEVRNESNQGKRAEKEIAAKRRDYFAAGTEIVWDVDLQSETVVKSFHRDAPDEPRVFRRGGTADAEPALPGWTIAVDELFE